MSISYPGAKALLRQSVALICTYSGIAWVWRHIAPKPAVRILAYHGVEAIPTSHFSVSAKNFEQQIRLLAQNHNVMTIDDFAQALDSGGALPRSGIIVTFDDGFRNFLTDAVPILQKYRVPATCFVIAAKLEEEDPRFMNRAEVAAALQTGLVTIGCHSMNHRSIRQISPDERIVEVKMAKEKLETALGQPVTDFCYPYGTRNDFDDDSAEFIKNSGFRLALTSVNGLNTERSDRYKLRRTKIEEGDDIRTFERILGGAIDVWYFIDILLFVLQRRRRIKFR